MRKILRAMYGPVCQGTFLGGVAVAVFGLWKVWEPLAYLASGIIICLVAARASSTRENR